eukprot:jgi/Psemu1/316632/fgenesh1_kg.3695_\
MTEDQEVAWRALNDEEGDWYSAVFVLIFAYRYRMSKTLPGSLMLTQRTELVVSYLFYGIFTVLVYERTVGSRTILTGLGTGSSKLEKSS